MTTKQTITYDLLYSLYISERKSVDMIAHITGWGPTHINSLLHEFGIPVRKRSDALKGRIFSIEHREKISKAKQGRWHGETNPNWKGGVAYTRQTLRRIGEYASFRQRVLRAFGSHCFQCKKSLIEKCLHCGSRPDRHVHHIKSFADNPELRFSLSNAIVLCHLCHKIIHTK